jgi:hypothetical protein
MLRNLKAELIRKGYDKPESAIAQVLDCSEKTSRNKMLGETAITVPEAVKIIEKLFRDDQFTIDYLFKDFSVNKSV